MRGAPKNGVAAHFCAVWNPSGAKHVESLSFFLAAVVLCPRRTQYQDIFHDYTTAAQSMTNIFHFFLPLWYNNCKQLLYTYFTIIPSQHILRSNSRDSCCCYGIIKTDEPRTLDFSGVRGFLVTNV